MTIEHWNDSQLNQLAQTAHTSAMTQAEVVKALELMTLRMDRFTVWMEKVTEQVEKVVRHQEMLASSQQQLLDNQKSFASTAEQVIQVQGKLMDTISSTGAAVERLDCLMNYLIMRAGNSNQNQNGADNKNLDEDSDRPDLEINPEP